MNATRLDVVLPAGGRITGGFAEEASASLKALIRINGTCMLEHTIETLRLTDGIGRIVVVGPPELALHPASRNADAVLPERTSGPENILAAVDYLEAVAGESRRLLIVATDLPCLTPRTITGFINQCPDDAEICVPIVRRGDYLGRFPGSPATFVTLADGQRTMGCAFLVDPQALRRNRRAVQQAFDARKSEIAMAKLLGPLFVLKFVTRRFRVHDVEKRCGQILGCRGVAVRNAPPELAADIDTVADYRYLERVGRGAGSALFTITEASRYYVGRRDGWNRT